MAYSFLSQAFFQGRFVPFEQANVSIATHALHYGTAAFGGLRVATTEPNTALFFRLDDHARRLSESAQYLWYDLSAETIRQTLIDFVQENKPQNPIYIRPLVYTSDLGIAPRLDNTVEKDFLIYGMEMGDYLSGAGVRCTISSYMRQMDASFPLRGKISGAYITSGLAKSEAKSRWFDEAILMNHQGKVCEGTGMNIFMVRKGELITPSVDQDILEGITRDSVIQIAQKMGLTVTERPVDKSELSRADEVFLCGTAARITPVTHIEQYTLPSGNPITQQIKQAFDHIVTGKDETFSHWITRVCW